jgi:3-hydroxybutyryl-CoA dehydratase
MSMNRFNRSELVTSSKTIDRAAILRYAEITDDFNPIHVDPDFAATTPMRGIIAHGMLSLNLVWQALKATYGVAAVEAAKLEVRFVRPVRENDIVTASGRLSTGSDGTYEVAVTNQDGAPVITGTLTLST